MRISEDSEDGTIDPAFQSPRFNAAITLFAETTGGKVLVYVPDPNVGEKVFRLNSDGSLDSTFTPYFFPNLRSLPLTAPDGKILLGGGYLAASNLRGIVRLNPDGSVDPGFSTPNSTVISSNLGIYALGLQSDGKIIVGGFALRPGGVSSSFMRLNANGSLDTSFAATVFPSALGTIPRSMLVLPDDRIVAAGSGATALRVLANGTIDPTFSPPAITASAVTSNTSHRLTRASNGRIILATGVENQRSTLAGGGLAGSLLSFADDGNLSAGFTAPVIDRESYGVTLTLQGSARLASGSFDRFGATPSAPIVRLNNDGTRDTTFALFSSLSLWQETTGLASLSDGRIFASYTEDFASSNTVQRLVRLDANGSLEASLSPSPALTRGTTVRTTADGKLLVNRPAFDPEGALANVRPLRRLLADGTEDPTWVGSAIPSDLVTREFGTQVPQRIDLVTAVLHSVYPEGRMLVTVFPGASTVVLRRLLPDGSSDPSFNAYSVPSSLVATGSLAFDPVTNQTLSVTVFRALTQGIETVDLGPDGSIVLAGPLDFGSGNYAPRIVKLLPDGTVDATFSVGTGPALASGLTAKVQRVRSAPDGKIWVLGNFDRFNGTSVQGIVRLNANGSVDATASFPVGWTDYGATGADVGFELDGRVYLTGAFAQPGEKIPFSVVKLQGVPLVPIPTVTPVPLPMPTPTPTVTPTPGATPTVTPTPTPTPTATPIPTPTPRDAYLRNVSTRLFASTGDSIPIAGFAVRAGGQKIAIRVLGPTLGNFGVSNVLADPTLELRDAGGNLLASNDNYGTLSTSNLVDLSLASLTPPNSNESALVQVLPEGTYTALVRGVNGTSGNCLVEVYELQPLNPPVRLVNISTRGQVLTGDSVMIGGFVVGGITPRRFLVRSLGPTLTGFGVPNALADPTLEIVAGQTSLVSNDDWQSTQQAEIQASGFAPGNAKEPAVIVTLGPGSYTAIVRGNNGTTGNAIVEVYELP